MWGHDIMQKHPHDPRRERLSAGARIADGHPTKRDGQTHNVELRVTQRSQPLFKIWYIVSPQLDPIPRPANVAVTFMPLPLPLNG